MQLFIRPKVTEKGRATVTVRPQETVGSLRKKLMYYHTFKDVDTARTAHRFQPDIRLSYRGKPLMNDERLLSDEGVTHGGTLDVAVRLRGGSLAKYEIVTRFGCLIGSSCLCALWCSGRRYEVETDNINTAAALYDLIAEQNPAHKTSRFQGTFLCPDGALLKRDRKIIAYEINENDSITFVMPPWYLLKGSYRKTPLDKQLRDEDADDEEYQAALKRLEKKKKAETEEAAAAGESPH